MLDNTENYNVDSCDTCTPNSCLNDGVCQVTNNINIGICNSRHICVVFMLKYIIVYYRKREMIADLFVYVLKASLAPIVVVPEKPVARVYVDQENVKTLPMDINVLAQLTTRAEGEKLFYVMFVDDFCLIL